MVSEIMGEAGMSQQTWVLVAFVALGAVLMLVAFAAVLRPLWRRKPLPAALMIAALCLGTAGIYKMVGTPAALDREALRQPQTLEEAIALLERQMRQAPEREGLALLANAYARSGQSAKSRATWERAVTLAADDPNVLAAAAEARAATDPAGRFDGRALGWLEQALRLNPQHQRARFFLGLALRQQGKAADAVRTWEPLLSQLDPANSVTLRKEIEAARKDAGMPPSMPANDTAATAQGLTVKVTLDPEFAARVRLRGDASVFVIARAPDGPPMPVAVEKHRVADLPLTVTLDDSDGPMPTAKLSALQEVELLARLSESGDAKAQDGDLESAPVRVRLPAKAPVTLVLGR